MEREQEIKRIFDACIELPPAHRGAYLDAHCPPDLRDEVERLLRHYQSPSPRVDLSGGAADWLGLKPTVPADAPGVGVKNFASYALHREIGRGGMGIVYAGVQDPLSRPVAIKILPKTLLLSAHEIDRFRREAATVARMRHPHIVSVYEYGEQPEFYYFAMELVDGDDLREVLARAASPDPEARSPLPSYHAPGYCAAVCQRMAHAADAVSYAHGLGVIHRDIKPSNIILASDGGTKLVDFGLARDHRLGQITQTRDWGGTPSYMSPEQIRAKSMRVDERTDIYSLGVVLYEALTLRRPFTGNTSNEIASQILAHRPIPPRSLNPRIARDLEVIVMTAMASRQEDRYASAGVLRDDLRRFLNHEAIFARPLPFREAAARYLKRRWKRLAAIGCVVISLALTIVVMSQRARAREIRAERLQAAQWLEQDLSLAPVDQVAAMAASARRFRRLYPKADAPEMDRLEAGLDAFREARLTEALAEIERARDARLSDGQREQIRLGALSALVALQAAFPDDQTIREKASTEVAYPRLTVSATSRDGTAIGARVYLRELDPFTSEPGPRTELGAAPVSAALLPGFYRVIVVFDDGGFREAPVVAGPQQMEVVVNAVRRDDEATVARRMILLEGTSYAWAPLSGQPFPQAGVTTQIADFYLDPCEVTNGEYQAFLEANPDRLPPPSWPETLDSDAADLPVTDVTWQDASAYAAWAGKRLPTWAEWLYATLGAEGRATPWIQTGPDDLARGNVGGPRRVGGSPAARWAEYRRWVAPACGSEDAATPEGVRNLWGNVSEWTESLGFQLFDAGATPEPMSRLFVGGAWDARAEGSRIADPATFGIDNFSRTHALGFRCARSAEP